MRFIVVADFAQLLSHLRAKAHPLRHSSSPHKAFGFAWPPFLWAALMRKAFCGLSLCGGEARFDRRWSSCACESRVPCCAAFSWVDRSESSLTPLYRLILGKLCSPVVKRNLFSIAKLVQAVKVHAFFMRNITFCSAFLLSAMRCIICVKL